jgi:hypothetical protein
MDALGDVFSDTSVSNEYIERLEEDIRRLKAKKDHIIDLYADQLISKEEFKRKSDEIDKKIIGFEQQKDQAESNVGYSLNIDKRLKRSRRSLNWSLLTRIV